MMNREQKIVALGAVSGVAVMILSVGVLAQALPAPMLVDGLAERLAYAARASVVAILPLFVMFISIGNSRFLSDAIDPTRRAESPRMIIDGRAADNTLQQTFVFVVATFALSTVLPSGQMQVVWACTIVFVFARVAFWIGYRIHPLYRAPGMSATAYLNLGMILYVLLRLIFA